MRDRDRALAFSLVHAISLELVTLIGRAERAHLVVSSARIFYTTHRRRLSAHALILRILGERSENSSTYNYTTISDNIATYLQVLSY